MMKRIIPLAFLLLALTISVAHAQKPGLGVSDLEIQKTLAIGETETFYVAQVYNVGTLNFSIASTWIPDYNGSGIEVSLTPNPLRLTPDKSASVHAEVTAIESGNYSGKIQFDCNVEWPPEFTGSKTEPGGSARATFIIEASEPTTPQPQPTPPFHIPTTTLVYGAVATTGVTLAVAMIYLKRRGKIHFPKPSTPKPIEKPSSDALPLGRLESVKAKGSLVVSHGEVRLINEQDCPVCGARMITDKCGYCGYENT